MIDVDTGLGANTGYTCSLAGSRWHYGVKGASETYIQEGWGYKGGKDGGFRLYLTWAEGVADGAPTVKEAENYGWYVNWIGRG